MATYIVVEHADILRDRRNRQKPDEIKGGTTIQNLSPYTRHKLPAHPKRRCGRNRRRRHTKHKQMMAQRPLLSGNCTAPQCAEHPHRRIVRTARKYSHGRAKRKRGKAAENNYASAQSPVRKSINHDSNYIICTAPDAFSQRPMRIRFGLILKITVWTKSYIPPKQRYFTKRPIYR